MTKLTGTEIAKLTATITGGGYKRANSKDAAIKRYLKAAAEAGMMEPEMLLEQPFEDAVKSIREFQAEISGALDAEPVAMDAKAPSTDAKAKPSKADGHPAPAPRGKRAMIEAEARAGKLPEAPDFSAETHKPYRKRLAEVVAMAEAGNLAGLKAFEIKTYSSSPKAIARYRDLAILAIENGAKEAPKPKKPLTEMKVEEYNDSIISEAVKYVATRKAGQGKFDTREAPTEAKIREIAKQMGVGTMINAVNAAGRQALIGTIR